MVEKWIQKAIKHPGALRKQLHVKGDKPIPKGKLDAAAKKGGKIGARARLAETLKGMHHGTPETEEANRRAREAGSVGGNPFKHGMQMGEGGYGLSHGEDSGDTEDGMAPITDNSHEFKGGQ
jgi:hypothetical protein